MPRRPKSPQEKKRLSLQKDRRNTYGENAKSSRKNIPKSKALSHRKVRHAAKDAIGHLVKSSGAKAEIMESTLTKPRLQKGRWHKSPDTPLGLVVKRKITWRKKPVGARQRRQAKPTGRPSE